MTTVPIHLTVWCILMGIMSINSEIITKHFTEQPLYTDSFLKVDIAEEHIAESFFACALKCGPLCSCVGFLEATKRCRVFDFCNTTDYVNESGWVYYTTPSGQECDGDWKEYNGHYYLLSRTNLSHSDATRECQKCGAFLVEINDAEENNWIKDVLLQDIYCTNKYDCTTWSGGTDIETEGQFVWSHSKTPFNYTNWDPINPNDYQYRIKNRDCVDIFHNGQWNDRLCDNLQNFICEK